MTDDLWSRARGSAGDNYTFHPKEFGDPLSMRGQLTAYERRHGEEYTGLRLPLGCAVKYRPSDPELKAKHKFDTPTRDGVFVGWEVQPGGVWKGDYIVADAEDLLAGKGTTHIVKELRDPVEIEFPLRQAKLKYEWPVETVIAGADGSREKKRRVSSRPDYIDS